MEQETIKNLLINSGLENVSIKDGLIYFQDPSCILPAFDTILEYAWIVIIILTAFMLLGWAILYIKNGLNEHFFHNIKSLILIFCILGAVKPVVNVIYGENLFARHCDIKQVSYSNVQELLDMRNSKFKQSDEALLYESFTVNDSGAIFSDQIEGAADAYYSQQNNMNNSDISGYGNGYYSTTRDYNTNGYDNGYSVTTTDFDANNSSVQSNVSRIEYANKTTIYVNFDGKKIACIGGSSSWRNNNPGNIRANPKIAKTLGASDASGTWMVFPNEQAGLNAIVKLLHSKNYINLSVKDAIHRWAPFGDGNNNPVAYSNKITKLTGLSSNAIIKNLNNVDMQKVANAIKQIEGWNIGKKQTM